MVFDQKLRQISKGLKKIKALQVKQHNLLHGTPVVPKAKALKRVLQSLNLSLNLHLLQLILRNMVLFHKAIFQN